MRKRELDKFRSALEEERERIKKSLKRHQASVKKVEEDGGERAAHSNHVADQGTDEFSYEQLLNLVKSESRYLYRVEEALQRIDEGSYGKCELCGNDIGKARLEALPYTRMCIECAEKEESKR